MQATSSSLRPTWRRVAVAALVTAAVAAFTQGAAAAPARTSTLAQTVRDGLRKHLQGA